LWPCLATACAVAAVDRATSRRNSAPNQSTVTMGSFPTTHASCLQPCRRGLRTEDHEGRPPPLSLREQVRAWRGAGHPLRNPIAEALAGDRVAVRGRAQPARGLRGPPISQCCARNACAYAGCSPPTTGRCPGQCRTQFFDDNEIWLTRVLTRGRDTGTLEFTGTPTETAANDRQQPRRGHAGGANHSATSERFEQVANRLLANLCSAGTTSRGGERARSAGPCRGFAHRP